jgi:metal-responsive CopG/Arc/MetJ family transcriptional regulator
MGVNPNRRIHQLSLDAAADKDILDWLNNIPKRRRSEAIRQAIRCFINVQISGTGASALPIISRTDNVEKETNRIKAEADDWDM